MPLTNSMRQTKISNTIFNMKSTIQWAFGSYHS